MAYEVTYGEPGEEEALSAMSPTIAWAIRNAKAEVEAAMDELRHAIAHPQSQARYRDWLVSMLEKAQAKRAAAAAAPHGLLHIRRDGKDITVPASFIVEQADQLITELERRMAYLDSPDGATLP